MNDMPQPDPSWDYATIWELTGQMGEQLFEVNSYLLTVENATPETDKKARELLEKLRASVEEAIALLPNK